MQSERGHCGLQSATFESEDNVDYKKSGENKQKTKKYKTTKNKDSFSQKLRKTEDLRSYHGCGHVWPFALFSLLNLLSALCLSASL